MHIQNTPISRSHKAVFTLLALAFLLVSTQHKSADAEDIGVIAIEYPPFSGAKLPNFGISFELLDAYATQHFKHPIKPQFVPPARAQRIVNQREWCLSLYPPKEKTGIANFVALSDEIVTMRLVRRAENTPFSWDSLVELNGKTVAIFRTPLLGPVHFQFINAGMKFEPIDTLEQGFHMLVRERVDFVFADDNALKHIDIEPFGKKDFQFSENAILEAQVGFYYNKACTDKIFKSAPQN